MTNLFAVMVYDDKASVEELAQMAMRAWEQRFDMPATHVEIPQGCQVELPGVVVKAVRNCLPHHALAGIEINPGLKEMGK